MYKKAEVCFLFLDPQAEVGPSVSSSVILCFFVLLVYIVMLVLYIYISCFLYRAPIADPPTGLNNPEQTEHSLS
jgi:hypothetical protein